MKQKLIKLSSTHYIIVDDSNIKEGDLFYHPNKALATQIEQCNNIVMNDSVLLINGFNWYVCKKIKYSTQPELLISLLGINCTQSVKPLLLSEVEELVNGYSAEKMAEDEFPYIQIGFTEKLDKKDIPYVPRKQREAYELGFKAHEELVKDKMFTLEDLEWAFIRGALINQRSHKGEQLSFSEERNKNIQSLLPKTEWDIEFINDKIKLCI